MSDPIYIGFSNLLTMEKAHGLVFVDSKNGQIGFPFIVNQPEALVAPSEEVVTELFKQILKIGIKPISLQFTVGETHPIYIWEKNDA